MFPINYLNQINQINAHIQEAANVPLPQQADLPRPIPCQEIFDTMVRNQAEISSPRSTPPVSLYL